MIGNLTRVNMKNNSKRKFVQITSEEVKEKLPLIDRIKDIEGVYKELGRIMPTIKNYYFLPENKREKALYNQYAEDINELFNEGWKSDWSNYGQYKYYPYFKKIGDSWLYIGYIFGNSVAGHGSAFYFKESKIAVYCGKTFLHVYIKLIEHNMY